jgi:hypothetical protein
MKVRNRHASAVVAAFALASLAGRAAAEHVESYVRPGEPTRLFPPGFTIPLDAQSHGELYSWKDPRMGGWGGDYPGAEECPAGHVARTPVVFVHGTSEDAPTAWTATDNGVTTVNVRKRFLDAGWCARELWAPSYTGARGYFTYNEANTDEVYEFIQNVRAYTGASQVDVVAHSLGVTVVRKAIRDRFTTDPGVSWLRRFVASGGANHGTTTCRGLGDVGGTGFAASHACEELEPGSPWLDLLNGIGETPGGAERYVVVYDSLADNFYLGPDARSPRLAGACNHDLPARFHLPIGRGPEATAIYIGFFATGALPSCDP